MDDRKHFHAQWLDLLSGDELLSRQLGYCPQIDKDTRGILIALMCDLNNLRGTMDPEEQREQWESALFMTQILEDILSRDHENTRLPESVVWLDRYR